MYRELLSLTTGRIRFLQIPIRATRQRANGLTQQHSLNKLQERLEIRTGILSMGRSIRLGCVPEPSIPFGESWVDVQSGRVQRFESPNLGQSYNIHHQCTVWENHHLCQPRILQVGAKVIF